MAFPQTPLPIVVEMLIDGVWTSISSPNRIRADSEITITRGGSNRQSSVSAQTCQFTVDNDDAFFSNRNPASVNYGKLPNSTQVRASVSNSTRSLLLLDYEDGSRAKTTDKAALDIVGDIDVRIDIEPVRWRNGDRRMLLCGKWVRTTQQSWIVRVDELGYARYSWSTGGTDATVVTVASTARMPMTGRKALRVTHDVNNGAGGNTVTFYTSDTINGAWTILGAAVITAGVTSIFSSTAEVEIGTASAGAGYGEVFSTTDPFVGRIYGMEVRNSAGTLVADFDPTAQAEGATSWADGLGNTWTIEEQAEVTTADRRFTGELSAAPMSWDGTGRDVVANITASGVLRRLGQGNTPLRSPIFRNLSTMEPTGYWPMEDDSGAATAGNAVAGGQAATVVDATFGSDDALPASSGVLRLGGTGPIVSGTALSTANGTLANLVFYVCFPSIPLSDVTIISVFGNGAVRRWDLVVGTAAYSINGYDGDGTLIAGGPVLFSGGEPDQWVAFNLKLETNGANTDMDFVWHVVGGDGFLSLTDSYAGTTGRFTSWITQGVAALSDVKIAHVMLTQYDVPFLTIPFRDTSNAYFGETSTERFERLCSEEGIQAFVVGDRDDVETMGYQPIDTLIEILEDCAAAEQGILYEPRDALGLTLRTRASLHNQRGAALDYSLKHLSGALDPTPDDQNIRNDITATRPFGSFRRSVVESGPMSIQAPPDGVGRFDSSEVVNVSTDDRLQSSAENLTFLGTWDEDRYPRVQVDLHRDALLADAALSALVCRTDVGDYLSIDNMPTFATYDLVELIAVGMQERLGTFNWSFIFNANPYGPYYAEYLENDEVYEGRCAETDTTLGADINTTATSLSLVTPSPYPVWVTTATHPAEFPLDIVVGGEIMTVTAIVNATSPQTATVTRSVNGVVKSHLINAPVIVRFPIRATH